MNISNKISLLIISGMLVCLYAPAQNKYTRADTLKGTYSKERDWWDALHYELRVTFNFADSSIAGKNNITYKVLKANNVLQLDLMQPMVLDSVLQDGKPCAWKRDGNAYFVKLEGLQNINDVKKLTAVFHGKPRVAKNPPWEGGMVWTRDAKGNPWASIACQGMAAQVWFPNKDHMADEPDSADLIFTCAKDLAVISNGRFKNVKVDEHSLTFSWKVKNPINNYNIIPYLGRYLSIRDTLNGAGGILDLEYWVLNHNYQKASSHFAQVKSMLRCFEYWFGPYPFYEDSYKLVEAPYLGMEHQGAIAYGNDFMMGYRGRDLSLTGWGLKWDFIIVHESGHEWFGNNISAKDVADNWIHESFTAYAENLYVEYLHGKEAGAEYVIGTRKSVLNDKPMIGDYNVNRDGSGDVYYKGANMLHTLRHWLNNDTVWRKTLKGLNEKFRHKTVTTKEIEEYVSASTGLKLQTFFDQYLRQSKLPVFEYKLSGNKIQYRWTQCVKGFDMPMKVKIDGAWLTLEPRTKWKKIKCTGGKIEVDKNFFVGLKGN